MVVVVVVAVVVVAALQWTLHSVNSTALPAACGVLGSVSWLAGCPAPGLTGGSWW